MLVDPSNLKILIVDDYKTMLRVIRNLLLQIGFREIDEATDGEMAIGMIKSKHYHLVISDWNMQPMTGIDLLKAVRSNLAPELPFIMITAESKVENVVTA